MRWSSFASPTRTRTTDRSARAKLAAHNTVFDVEDDDPAAVVADGQDGVDEPHAGGRGTIEVKRCESAPRFPKHAVELNTGRRAAVHDRQIVGERERGDLRNFVRVGSITHDERLAGHPR